MKIGYVKIRKRQVKEDFLKNIVEKIIYKIYDMFNIVEQDKYSKNIFRVTNFTKRSKEKLLNKIRKERIDYVLVEKNKLIPYPTLDGQCLMKSMLPEIVSYCNKALKPSINEIHICTNTYNDENVAIIRELTKLTKVVNIVTNNKNYYKLEKKLEEEEVFVTVSSNRRKSLKQAIILVNLDLDNLNEYNINRNMVIIDITGMMDLPKSFNGIVIKSITVDTKRVLRVLSEFKGFDRSKLIEAEILKLNDYFQKRNYINMAKLYISEFYSNRKITSKEFNRLHQTIKRE